MERKPTGLILVLIGHVLVAAWTWRDIRQRPAPQIRGSKALWRVLSAMNTLGSAGYWLIGRRYGRSRSGGTGSQLASS
jgi:glucose dehydrogenase